MLNILKSSKNKETLLFLKNRFETGKRAPRIRPSCDGNLWTRHRRRSPSHNNAVPTNALQIGHDGRVSDKLRRLPRHQHAQAHNITHYRQPLSFMYWLFSKQNCLLCAYEHDFGDN
jgi:hypothetical protein